MRFNSIINVIAMLDLNMLNVQSITIIQKKKNKRNEY